MRGLGADAPRRVRLDARGPHVFPLPARRPAPSAAPPQHQEPGRGGRHVARVSFHDDCAHVFGEKGHIAGIPTCSKCSAVGARLRYTLRNRPHEFVALARQEMQEIIARPDAAPPARMVTPAAELRRRREASAELARPHYASIRSRLEASLSRSGVSALDADPDQPVRGVLPSAAKFQEVMDVLYFWALGEAYLQHPQLQADMRQSLGRAGAGPLAAEGDCLELRSRVQLLDGPFYEGSYLIGSVNFVSMASIDDATGGCEEAAGWAPHDEELPQPSMDAIFRSEVGRSLLAAEGDQPTRMQRQSAARSYSLYTLWGYCHRSLEADRARASKQNGVASTSSSGSSSGSGGGGSGSGSGSSRRSAATWRYFENLPGQASRWRTNEASAVADRHLRALFGEQEESITTLHAWKQMTHEAKWFGRALYDAEEFVLRACLPSLQG